MVVVTSSTLVCVLLAILSPSLPRLGKEKGKRKVDISIHYIFHSKNDMLKWNSCNGNAAMESMLCRMCIINVSCKCRKVKNLKICLKPPLPDAQRIFSGKPLSIETSLLKKVAHYLKKKNQKSPENVVIERLKLSLKHHKSGKMIDCNANFCLSSFE